MKSIQLCRFDGPDGLEVIETPKPIPAPREVLIRVQAAGVNFFETLMLRNRYAVTPRLPMILGVEVAGVIEAVGSDAHTEIGRRVAVPLFAAGQSGGYAEYVCVDESFIVPIPDALSCETAVALMVQGLTALHAIRRTSPQGKSVLITAAAGGVGTLLVQLAKRAGARHVTAAASTADKLERACDLGADRCTPYSHLSSGVDVVYDFVGGKSTATLLQVLAPQGELLLGALGRVDLGKDVLEAMIERNQSLKGFALIPLLTDSLKTDLIELFQLAVTGQLRVVLNARFPLSQARDAHRLIEERRSVGKVVFTV